MTSPENPQNDWFSLTCSVHSISNALNKKYWNTQRSSSDRYCNLRKAVLCCDLRGQFDESGMFASKYGTKAMMLTISNPPPTLHIVTPMFYWWVDGMRTLSKFICSKTVIAAVVLHCHALWLLFPKDCPVGLKVHRSDVVEMCFPVNVWTLS